MTEIHIVFKNEFSGEMQKMRLALESVKREVKDKSPLGKKELASLERFAGNVGREVVSGFRVVGITASFTSGGIVAAIAAIFNALEGFASAGLTQHAIAREVGLTYEQYERFVVAAKATGMTDEEARAGVERMTRAIRNLQLGTRSATWQKLEEAPGGSQLARRLQTSLVENGLDATIKLIFEEMAKSVASGGPNGRWAAQVLAEALDLQGDGWNHVFEMLQKVSRSAVPDEAAAKKFLLAQRKNSIAWSRVINAVRAVLIPAFTRLLEVVSKIFNEENNKAFIQFVNDLIEGLIALDWDWIRQKIDQVLGWIGKEIVLFSEDLASFVEDIDKFIQAIDRFRGRAVANDKWEKAKPVPYTPQLNLGEFQPQQFMTTPSADFAPDELVPGDAEESQVIRDIFNKPASGEDFATRLIRVAPKSTNIIDLRGQEEALPPKAEMTGLEQSANRLTDQVDALTFEMRRLVDVFRDIREGEGGGSSDGGVSRKARTRPMRTRAGGRGRGQPNVPKRPETPQEKSMREDQKAADRRLQVAPESTPPPKGRRTVKASFYSNYSEKQGSKLPGGWVDKGDMDKRGNPLPAYGGYDLSVPGVALPYRAAVGAPGAQGGRAVRVWRPDGKGSDIVRAIDTGPSQTNVHSKDKGIDINAPLAERWGYVSNKEQSRITGRPVFPSVTQIDYHVLDTSDFLRARTEVQREAWKQRGEGKPPPWLRSGSKLNLEVNVEGPRGVQVDATAEGYDENNVRVNRDLGGGGSFGGGGASGTIPPLL